MICVFPETKEGLIRPSLSICPVVMCLAVRDLVWEACAGPVDERSEVWVEWGGGISSVEEQGDGDSSIRL